MIFQKEEAIALFVATLMLIWFSWKPLRAPGGHGIYRFFAWEAIAVLIICNWRAAIYFPTRRWIFLSHHVPDQSDFGPGRLFHIKKHGEITQSREETAGLDDWEKTTRLVDTGIYSLIRHPMYSALLLVTWAAYTSAQSWLGLLPAAISTLLLWATAKKDEMECATYFEPPWQDYTRRTRMFIPWIL